MAVIERQASRTAVVEPASLASVGVCSNPTTAFRIVLVEPDSAYRADLSAQLWKRGFAVRGFDDAVALLTAPDALDDADVIVASWGMPRMSGLELSSRLHRQGITVPVVLLAGRVLSGRECLAVDPDTGKVVAKTRGVEALVGHLQTVAKPTAKKARP
jgi:DNA-binding response OmpR family regulator